MAWLLSLLGPFGLLLLGLVVPWAFFMSWAWFGEFDDPKEREGWIRSGMFTGVLVCLFLLEFAMGLTT